MITPRRVRKGEPVTAESFNRLVDAINERTPLRGTLRFKTTPRGFIPIADPIAASKPGAAAVVHFPWEITVDGNADDGYVAHVQPGTVNSLVPENIFEEFDVSTGDYYVKLGCDTDGKTVTSIEVIVDNTPPDVMAAEENAAPSSFDDVIGMIRGELSEDDPDTTVFRVFQIRRTNLTATPIIAFIASQTPEDPGDEPFVRWFKWNLTSSGG